MDSKRLAGIARAQPPTTETLAGTPYAEKSSAS